jgi:hypothetical protein
MIFGIQPTQSPFNPLMTAVQISMQDTAAFHAGLALFASIRANTQRSGSQSETIYHKLESMRMVSSRLDRCEALSDWTIHAVMLLWGLEVCTYKSYKVSHHEFN